ncbi:amino acid deaminase, partial [Paraburkholderia sp. SIMBA_027]
GIRRVLMANQLVGRANMALIAKLLRDPAFTYFCIVDSVANAAQLADSSVRIKAAAATLREQYGSTGYATRGALVAAQAL